MAKNASFEIDNTYKPFGGILKCPKIESGEFQSYLEMVNSQIESDGVLNRVHVALLDDKPYHFDYDVYLEPNTDVINVVNGIFGFHENNNINGNCYSLQIGKFQTDFITLKDPAMGRPFYSVSCGLLLHLLLSNSVVKIRDTDLCCKVGTDTFIISTDPAKTYEFLGLDLDALLKMHTRQELFSMIQHSWIYDPELILELTKTKSKDMKRPLACDFVEFSKTNPRLSELPKSKELMDILSHFGKTAEYEQFVLKKEEDKREMKLRADAKTLITNELKNRKFVGVDISNTFNKFKEWVFATFNVDYDNWVITKGINIKDTLDMFLK